MGKNVGKDVGGSVSIIAIAGFKLGNIVGVTVLFYVDGTRGMRERVW